MSSVNMTAVATQHASDLCRDYGALSFSLSKWFLIFALIAAALHAIGAFVAHLQPSLAANENEPKQTNLGAVATLLDALKGLLESLAKLPAWVVLFLAGFALLWMAGQRPEVCTPAKTESPQPR